jgi:MFS family permease
MMPFEPSHPEKNNHWETPLSTVHTPSGPPLGEAAATLARAAAKVKRHVLPLFVVMFIVNYIDRVNIGFVRSHMETDLGIGAAAYGLGAGLFFVGYALFEVPSNMLLQRYGARAWLTRIMLTWGIAAMAMAFVQGEVSFYVLRFILGAAEAGFFPGIIYYFTQWLPAADRGKAMAIFLSGSAIASVISGPVSGALLNVSGLDLHGWQWMFLIEGFASVVLCGFVWFWLQSHIHEAKWLTEEEKQVLAGAIAQEQRDREAEQSVRPSMFRLLADRQIALFCFIYFSIALTIYGATFWLPSMIKKMGSMGDFQVGLFNSVPWIISIVAMYGFAALAGKWKFQQAWVSLTLVIAAAGMFMSTTGGPVFAFVSICFAAIGFKAASALFWPIPQGYLDARIAAAVIALINSVGNLGGFVAPTAFGFLEQTTGSIEGGLYGLALTSLIAAVVIFFARTRPRGDKRPVAADLSRQPAAFNDAPARAVAPDSSAQHHAFKPEFPGAAS